MIFSKMKMFTSVEKMNFNLKSRPIKIFSSSYQSLSFLAFPFVLNKLIDINFLQPRKILESTSPKQIHFFDSLKYSIRTEQLKIFQVLSNFEALSDKDFRRLEDDILVILSIEVNIVLQ